MVVCVTEAVVLDSRTECVSSISATNLMIVDHFKGIVKCELLLLLNNDIVNQPSPPFLRTLKKWNNIDID